VLINTLFVDLATNVSVQGESALTGLRIRPPRRVRLTFPFNSQASRCSFRPSSKRCIPECQRYKSSSGLVSSIDLARQLDHLLTIQTAQELTPLIPYPSVPPYIVAFVWTLSLSWLSSRIDRRGFVLLASSPFAVAGYILFVATSLPDVNARYVSIPWSFLDRSKLTVARRLALSSASSALSPLAPT
jgi:hypothetical protein